MYWWYRLKAKLSRKPLVTCGDVVDKLDWANKEIEETQGALEVLSVRLQDGIVQMEKAAEESAEIIARHQEILGKAMDRQLEFSGKAQKVKDILSTVTTL